MTNQEVQKTTEKSQPVRRKLQGVVVSDKMQKTVIVKVDSIKTHPKYHKRYRVSKKFPAHSENNEYKIGDKVVIEEMTPKSRTKNWIVTKKI
jgi:small subunit ribosomal protein S17